MADILHFKTTSRVFGAYQDHTRFINGNFKSNEEFSEWRGHDGSDIFSGKEGYQILQ